MFLLDTNVLSAMMDTNPAPNVAEWVTGRPMARLFTASVCQAEILSGVAIMPEGRRRFDLEAATRAMFAEDFAGRILPFETQAATIYAEIFAARRRAGRSASTIDLMIAAIARTHGASVVTRNISDFDGCGVDMINPWDC